MQDSRCRLLDSREFKGKKDTVLVVTGVYNPEIIELSQYHSDVGHFRLSFASICHYVFIDS